eukprot:TRINITY_DN1608_c0_g4_i1.p2 TRINITY_DN1608_c0_g4~~TRINITY_DN1608_c0_g4_i1.p2  ORF type:complete len:182 (+),score=35.55 TRINITY_DN1608_c0_g4_i1:76-621(+)
MGCSLGKTDPTECGGCPLGCYCEANGSEDAPCWDGGMRTCRCYTRDFLIVASVGFVAALLGLAVLYRRQQRSGRWLMTSWGFSPGSAQKLAKLWTAVLGVIAAAYFLTAAVVHADAVRAVPCEKMCFTKHAPFFVSICAIPLLVLSGAGTLCVRCCQAPAPAGDTALECPDSADRKDADLY